ncbi:MAG: GNAT family N-acetyltransferase [Candidatus Heimdallarchaeota archaeon]
MKITKMTKKHLPEVIDVLAEAFHEWRIQRRGKDAVKRYRSPEYLIPYMELDPNGCLVAIDKRKVVGAIFAHVWGKYGWIGTFGVHPDYQNKGVGKKLMVEAIKYLDIEKNVTQLSLETMTSSAVNIGLYSKLGFKPAFQTMSLKKQIAFTPEKQKELSELLEKDRIEIQYFSEEPQQEDALTRCSWLSNKIESGLDYSSKIVVTEKYNQGETILLKKDGFIIAFANCRLITNVQGETDNPTLMVKILVIDKDEKNKQVFDALLLCCEDLGQKYGKTEFRMNINSSYWLAYEYLLKNGFQIRSSLLRMVKYSEDIKSYDHHHEWIVNCSALTM